MTLMKKVLRTGRPSDRSIRKTLTIYITIIIARVKAIGEFN